MKNRDAFSAFHPAVLCGYYALVLVFSMFLTHPLCLAASLLGALSYAAKLRGGRAVLRSLAWMAPVWLLAAAAALAAGTAIMVAVLPKRKKN